MTSAGAGDYHGLGTPFLLNTSDVSELSCLVSVLECWPPSKVEGIGRKGMLVHKLRILKYLDSFCIVTLYFDVLGTLCYAGVTNM